MLSCTSLFKLSAWMLIPCAFVYHTHKILCANHTSTHTLTTASNSTWHAHTHARKYKTILNLPSIARILFLYLLAFFVLHYKKAEGSSVENKGQTQSGPDHTKYTRGQMLKLSPSIYENFPSDFKT